MEKDFLSQYGLLKAFELFEDTLSREIFLSRTLTIASGDFKYHIEMLISRNTDLKFLIEANKGRQKDKIVIYGAGVYAKVIFEILTEQDVDVVCFCDSDNNKAGKRYCGKDIRSLTDLCKTHDASQLKFVIAIAGMRSVKQVDLELLKNKALPENILWIIDKNIPPLQYFDNDVVKSNGFETFVDAGSYDFESSQSFIKWCGGRYDKIFAFEPSAFNFKHIENIIGPYPDREKIELFNMALWSEKDSLTFLEDMDVLSSSRIQKNGGSTIVDAVKLDDILNGCPVTYIKMDVEGAEMNVLAGADKTIRKWRPKLAVCVYHKTHDFYNIPNLIKSKYPHYKFYMRHYSPSFGEAVLYCV